MQTITYNSVCLECASTKFRLTLSVKCLECQCWNVELPDKLVITIGYQTQTAYITPCKACRALQPMVGTFTDVPLNTISQSSSCSQVRN